MHLQLTQGKMKLLRMFNGYIFGMRSIMTTFHRPFIFQQVITPIKILTSFRKSHQRLLHTKNNNKIVD